MYVIIDTFDKDQKRRCINLKIKYQKLSINFSTSI